jgi:hypothetical protein
LNRRYQRTATTITSGGNRNPANADFGGSQRRGRLDDFTAQACLDHANAQRNSADGGPLAELAYGADDAPNYYNLVLVAPGAAESVTAELAAAGLPPDSIRYGYRPLYHRPLLARYATTCPNAEALAAATLQLPVHPGMPEAALKWVTDCVRALATAERPPS